MNSETISVLCIADLDPEFSLADPDPDPAFNIDTQYLLTEIYSNFFFKPFIIKIKF